MAAADRGRRLDHIWVSRRSPTASRRKIAARPAAGAPSDHVPVTVTIKL